MNLRRYPNLPGSPPSVTSLIRACMVRPALHQWEIEETAKLARKYPRESVKGILYRHDTGAAARGTRVHKAIQCELQGLPAPLFDAYDEDYYLEWQKWWGGGKWKSLASEVVCYSEQRSYAGTIDLIAEDAQGERVLVDWKTCTEVPREPYFDSVVQVAAYMMAEKIDLVCRAPTYSRGQLVYISRKEVRSFDVSGELLARGRLAWLGVLDVCRGMYPEAFK